MNSKNCNLDEFYLEILLALSGVQSSCIYQNQTSLIDLLEPSEALLLERLTTLGKSYCTIQCFIEETTSSEVSNDSVGLYLVSFAEQLGQSLLPYRKELKSLESIKPSISEVYAQIYEFYDLFTGLNLLIADIVRNKTYGVLILQTLYEHCIDSVGILQIALKYIYSKVCQLFFRQLQCWLLYGEITDSRQEFFIRRNVGAINQTPFEEFSLNYSLVPTFIRPLLAQKILNVGQTVLFLRSCPITTLSGSPCNANHAIDCTGVSEKRGECVAKEFQEVARAETWRQWCHVEKIVDSVAVLATTELHSLAKEDAKLEEQMRLIKDLFLMGRGELFREYLVQTDWKKCSGPLVKDLNVVLRNCARNVFLNEEALQPFHLELKQHDGNSQLNMLYSPPWPLQLLFTSSVIHSYNHIFRFLLRLKAVQVKMVDVWLQDKAKRKVTRGVKRRQLLQNLWFIVNNLLYYLQVDVLDSQFLSLEKAIARSQDFDEVRSAHNVFLANLISQSFLDSPKDDTDIVNPVQLRMNSLLKLCEDYCLRMDDMGQGEMSDEHVNELTLQFEAWFGGLFMLLAALKKQTGHPCSQHLGQLLLRLDFNHFFSNMISVTTSRGRVN